MTKENIREILIERNIKRALLQKSNNQGKKEPDNDKKRRGKVRSLIGKGKNRLCMLDKKVN